MYPNFFGESFENADSVKLLRHLANALESFVYGDMEEYEIQMEKTRNRLGSADEEIELERIEKLLLNTHEEH